jgi:hypothetical protein
MSDHERTNTTTKKAANSIVGKLTAGILAGAAALLAPGAAAQAPGTVLVVGDSLEVGSAPYLRQALPDVPLEIDAEKGRSSRQGVAVLAEKLRPDHGTIVFPLGTNDLTADGLGASLAALQQLAGGRCVVVATISRPPLAGSPAADLNRVVEQFAVRTGAQLADWRSAVLALPGLLGRDRVHTTASGASLRGSLLAEAVQSCLLGGDLAGIPAPRDPNARPPRRRRERPADRAGPPERRVRLPAPVVLGGLVGGLERILLLVRAAVRDAQAAASGGRPEPVLGSSD